MKTTKAVNTIDVTSIPKVLKILAAISLAVLLQACESEQDWQWEQVDARGEPTARHEASFVEHQGLMYLIGGRRINPVDVFDPTSLTWTEKSATPIELHHFQAVSLGDAIYLVGAMTGEYPNEIPLSNVIAYYPATDTFETLHEIPPSRRRGAAGAVVYDEKIYVIGGIANGHIDGYKPWLDEYDPSSGEWIALPDSAFARDHVQAVVQNNRLYVFGGRTSRQRTDQVLELLVEHGEVFDLRSQQWLPPQQDLALPTLRAGNMAMAWGNEVVVAGGESHTQKASHSEVDSFNAQTRTWRRWPDSLQGRHGSGLAIHNGYAYVASGSANRGGGPELTTIERLKLPDVDTTTVFDDSSVSPLIVQNWHTVTLDFEGPFVSEMDSENPFTAYRLDVEFRHGDERRAVRGFFAADGDAANTGADSGNIWRVRFTPDIEGNWRYSATLRKAENVAIADDPSTAPMIPITESAGEFIVIGSDKELPDFRANGFIIGDGPYFRFQDSDKHWIKTGANSPENILGYHEFDGNYRHGQNERDGEASAGDELHRFEPHSQDWQIGDPTWMGGKGKNIIGAYNYLASKGMNSNYFLTMNINGDGKDVWPFVNHEDFSRFDVSKLAQWNIVFEHMQAKGILLHVVTQETENERMLDDGDTGPQRKLYFNELIARFAHHPALVWNLGEENGPAEWSPDGQDDKQRKAMSGYLKAADPYGHPVLLHTHSTPESKDHLLPPQLGYLPLDGLSFQVEKRELVNQEVRRWREKSKEAGHEWLITMDEIGMWMYGAMPDDMDPNHDRIRGLVLWGSLMAGAAGLEWYFGAESAATDLTSEDWRLRERLWTLTNHARQFFENYLPYWEMTANNDLVDVEGAYVFSKSDEIYALYLPAPAKTMLDLSEAGGEFSVRWFDPLGGGELQTGSIDTLSGGGPVDLGAPPQPGRQDWVVLLRR